MRVGNISWQAPPWYQVTLPTTIILCMMNFLRRAIRTNDVVNSRSDIHMMNMKMKPKKKFISYMIITSIQKVASRASSVPGMQPSRENCLGIFRQ